MSSSDVDEEMEEYEIFEEVELPADDLEPQDMSSGSEDDQSEPKDDAVFVFSKHTGSVFSCALHPTDRSLAVTGGEDDKAYLWETETGHVLCECTGFKDSVSNVSFSYDGSYFVAGDMSGVIKVWKTSTRELVWDTSVSDINWIKWHHGTNALLCALTLGDVYMWKIPSGDMKIMPGHGQPTECGVIMPDGRRLAVGYGNGTVKLFALQACSQLGKVSAGEPDTNVYSMDVKDNNIIATGGSDGNIHVFNTQPLKIVWRFTCPKVPDGSDDFVEAVKFSGDQALPLLAAGTLKRGIFVLDYVKQVVRHEVVVGAGVSLLRWDPAPDSGVLYAASIDGVMRVYDGRGGYLQRKLRGHNESILDFSLSKKGNMLLCASSDHTCRIFNANPPER